MTSEQKDHAETTGSIYYHGDNLNIQMFDT